MPSCSIIFYRQSGLGANLVKTSDFAAIALKPMVDRLVNGSKIHLIHDIIQVFPIPSADMENFEDLIDKPKVYRRLKELDREWRYNAKSSLSAADTGISSKVYGPDESPEAPFVLETNSKRPLTIINHLGFYPFESVIEAIRCTVHLTLAKEKLEKKKIDECVDHLIQANFAMVACNLLKDLELIKQISMIGKDVVVLRSFEHLYLNHLEGADIPFVLDRFTILNFDEIVRRAGITFTPYVEPAELTFQEMAVNTIAAGGIDTGEHKKLMTLDLLLGGHLRESTIADDGERLKDAKRLALETYAEKDYKNENVFQEAS